MAPEGGRAGSLARCVFSYFHSISFFRHFSFRLGEKQIGDGQIQMRDDWW
jgi:hypothetical protein